MSTIPPPYLSLVDDAAIFPPGNAAIPEAVTAHRAHRQAPHADLVGNFVVDDARLPDLVALVSNGSTGDPALTGSTSGPLGISLVVTGGAGAVEPAVRWASRSSVLQARSVEIALRDDDSGAIEHNARRIVVAVDQIRMQGELDDEVPVYVEPPRLYGGPPTPGWLGALDEIAAADFRLKFRTGGVDADAFPAAHELAASIEAALDREVAFKCTAGLHHALRHRDEETGFEHHGFLNVLAATAQATRGVEVDDLAEILAEQEPGPFLEPDTEDELVRARRWFTSFGSCSVLEPLQDLVDLGLVEAGMVSTGSSDGGST